MQAFAANGRSKFAKLSENPSYPRTLYCFNVNESEFEPIRRLTKLGLHTAVLGHEETRRNQDFCQAKENVAETCFATTPTKLELRTYHGLTCTSHMNGLWRAAIGFDKNVVFLDVAARESYFHPPFEEFVHHQSRSCQACWKARPALSLGFALRNRPQDSELQVGKKTGGDAASNR